MAMYEKSGTGFIGVSGSGLAVLAAGGTAVIGVAAHMMVTPPPPDLGYHLPTDHHDIFGTGVFVGVGVAALYATLRAVRWQDLI
jgi:hypothetical protein